MLRAMAGSTSRAGGFSDPQGRQRQRDAVGDGERRHDQQELPHRAAEEQQPDQEQDMVGPDQDVVDARRHELADRRPGALPRAGQVFVLRLARRPGWPVR